MGNFELCRIRISDMLDDMPWWSGSSPISDSAATSTGIASAAKIKASDIWIGQARHAGHQPIRNDVRTHSIRTGYRNMCCRTRACQAAKKCSCPMGSSVADMLRAYRTLDSVTYTQKAVRI